MAKYQIESIQSWPAFEYDGKLHSLAHLNAHEMTFQGINHTYTFVVTYGLHCFAKEGTPYNIPVSYEDGREKITVCLERYLASKHIRHILTNLPSMRVYHTVAEKFFTLDMMNSATGVIEPYKICIAFYKEKRLLRMHILSAFFARTGPGSSGESIPNKSLSIFKIAMDTAKSPRSKTGPKEARNRF